jgi:hypothetical protein
VRRWARIGAEVSGAWPLRRHHDGALGGSYLKSSKNDGNHAETICETVGHPNTRFAPPTKVTVRMLVSNKAGHIDYVTVNAAR